MNLNECDIRNAKKPPIGIKPYLFVAEEENTTRQIDLLDAIIRYEDADLYVLEIWKAEVYARHLVPRSHIDSVLVHDSYVAFKFDNKMVVTINLKDNYIDSIVSRLVLARRLICRQRQ